jgi:hypothetical protein
MSPDDEVYVRSRFLPFGALVTRCGVAGTRLRSWQEAGLYPGPSYVTPDRQEWYPPSYAHLTRRAIYQREDLRDLFARDFLSALERLRDRDVEFYAVLIADTADPLGPEELALRAYWAGILSGDWGACLKEPWVRNMILRDRLVRRIDLLTSRPAPQLPHWTLRLRHAVETLDRLMLPFARCDATRTGRGRVRDSHVDLVRRRFPEVFEPVAPSAAGPATPEYPACRPGFVSAAASQRFV